MEKPVRKKNGKGVFVRTLVKWVMEASCLGSYIRSQKGSLFFNASLEGLPIPFASHLAPEDFLSLHCKKQFDLRALLHTQVEETIFSGLSKEGILENFSVLSASLQRCIPLFQQMLLEIERKQRLPFDPRSPFESGKMAVLEADLLSEEAYPVCLEPIFSVYRRILDRSYALPFDADDASVAQHVLQKNRQLWEECLIALHAFVKVLTKPGSEALRCTL